MSDRASVVVEQDNEQVSGLRFLICNRSLSALKSFCPSIKISLIAEDRNPHNPSGSNNKPNVLGVQVLFLKIWMDQL